MSKYIIKRYDNGLYNYDTIFIDVEDIEYQIPVLKGLIAHNVKEIEVGYLDRPIEEILEETIDK